MRTIVCTALTLVLFAGVSLAAEKAKKKKLTATMGEIVSVDNEKGTLTISVKGKKGSDPKEVEFKGIDDKTPVVSYSGDDKTELTGKDVLKKEQFKKGTKVTVLTDADGKIQEIRFGMGKKKAK